MIAELTTAATAAATTTALTGYLTAAGTEAGKTAGKEAVEQGKRLVGWLRERLRGPAKEALADLKIEPGEATASTFRRELEGQLEGDPALLEGLRAVLAEVPDAIRFGEQRVNQIGDHNKAGVAQGQSITVSIG